MAYHNEIKSLARRKLTKEFIFILLRLYPSKELLNQALGGRLSPKLTLQFIFMAMKTSKCGWALGDRLRS